jgi:hypothetical protein
MALRMGSFTGCIVALTVATLHYAPTALGQYVPLASVSSPTGISCSQGRNFYNDPKMVCSSVTFTCQGMDEITVLYGIDTPAPPLSGTIVMLSGDGGDTLPASFGEYIPGYLSAGYQVIEAEWARPRAAKTGKTRTATEEVIPTASLQRGAGRLLFLIGCEMGIKTVESAPEFGRRRAACAPTATAEVLGPSDMRLPGTTPALAEPRRGALATSIRLKWKTAQSLATSSRDARSRTAQAIRRPTSAT